MDVLLQALALAAFMSGVLLGELLAFKAFGRPKRVMMFFDVIFFIVLVTALFSFMQFFAVDVYFYSANFFVGIVSVVLIRSVEAALGMTERVRSTEDIAAKLVPMLARTGMDAEDMRKTLRSLGISEKKINKLSGDIEHAIPPYLPKIVRIYDQLDDIRTELARLVDALGHSRSKAVRAAAAKLEAEISAASETPEPEGETEESVERKETDKYGGLRPMIRAALERAEKEKLQAETENKVAETKPGNMPEEKPAHEKISKPKNKPKKPKKRKLSIWRFKRSNRKMSSRRKTKPRRKSEQKRKPAVRRKLVNMRGRRSR